MHRAQIESLGYSLLALVLVVVFIQTIGVWRWLSEELGKTGAMLVPFLVAILLLIFVFVARLRKKERFQFHWLYLVAARCRGRKFDTTILDLINQQRS